MKFIFPKNFYFKNKLFGVFDYSTIFFNIIWIAFIGLLVHFIFSDFILKIIFIILFCFPFLLISISGFHGENFLYVFRYIFCYCIKQKLYFYRKN